jgi:hypothetical protein
MVLIPPRQRDWSLRPLSVIDYGRFLRSGATTRPCVVACRPRDRVAASEDEGALIDSSWLRTSSQEVAGVGQIGQSNRAHLQSAWNNESGRERPYFGSWFRQYPPCI